jgi:two-component system chemotaxis sensor kinase CheA
MERCKHRLKELYGSLMELRLVPFETVAHRLTVGVRDLTARLDKQVRFRIHGREVRMDRTVLESLVEPLLHLVRNALDHGIEDLETRIENGKPGPGTVTLRLTQHHDRVRIDLEDDGRGLDPVRIRSAAVRKGFLDPAEAESLSDSEARLLVTLPGFSTAGSVGTVSGRGVGMDVVRDAVEGLGGRLLIDSTPGEGTTFHLDLPQTLAVIQAILVLAGGDLYALPISAVGKTLDLSLRKVARRDGAEFVELEEGPLELTCLEEKLHHRGGPLSAVGRGSALLPASSGRCAVAVDEILGRRDILVRPLEPPLRAMRIYTGAALLEDGSVALVVDSEVLSA